jgi:hypothetical protein
MDHPAPIEANTRAAVWFHTDSPHILRRNLTQRFQSDPETMPLQSIPARTVDLEQWHSVPSLTGLVLVCIGSRHFRAGLLLVTSLRDLARYEGPTRVWVGAPVFTGVPSSKADWSGFVRG